MLLISDSNIFISALISPKGTISKIIFSRRKFKIIAPYFLKVEVNRYKEKITKLSGYTEKELNTLLKELYNQIEFVDTSEIPKNYTKQAYDLVKDVDINDLDFVELALYKKCLLWTTDKILINGLRKKGFTKTITTTELKKYLYKKK